MTAPKDPGEPGGTPLSEQLRDSFERTTESAQRWIARAQEIARERGFAGVSLSSTGAAGGGAAGASATTAGASERLLAGGATLAKNRGAVSSAQVEKPEPTSMLDREAPPGGYGRPRARALPVDPYTLVLFWEWPERELPLRAGDVLVLQLVSTAVIDGEPAAFTQWADNVPVTGDYFFRGLPPGALHQAFIGVLREGLFEPVLYTEPVETPYGEPTPQVAVVRATLLLPPRVEGRPGLVPVVDASVAPRIVRIEGPAPELSALVGEPPAAQWADVERVETESRALGEGVPFGARPTVVSEQAGEQNEEGAEGAGQTDRRGVWMPAGMSSGRRFVVASSPGAWQR